jgi:hypothetical protein
MGWTCLVDGKQATKTGSKIAARYRASIGEALEAAMMEPSLGKRAWCCARDLNIVSRSLSLLSLT